MNTTILQKCLSELEKETPKLDYVRGMLETLISLEPQQKNEVETHALKKVVESGQLYNIPARDSHDESSILDGVATAKLEQIKRVASQSMS